MEIEVDAKTPFSVGAMHVARVVIAPISFIAYAACYGERLKELARTNDEMQAMKAFMRARRLVQVTAYNRANVAVPLDHVAFGAMPRQLFAKINAALNTDDNPKGSVLSGDGDGIYTPIIYRLGTPFIYADSKIASKPIGTESKIVELEFIAKTGGDIEEVLCSDNSLEQTIALIKTCATPLGGDAGYLRLPTWMLSALTVSDGFEIMKSVLPVFLE